MLRSLLHEEQAKFMELDYAHDLVLLQAAAVNKVDSLSDFAELVSSRKAALRDHLHPWQAEQERLARKNTVKKMEENWAKAWGDPNDPEIRARIENTAAALLNIS